MKIAVLGGSFNPVHSGHLILADSVCSDLGYDKLLFIPAFQPPHKIIRDAAAAEDRINMLRLACEDDERFAVETCEIERGGISYTWDTVCFLEQKYSSVLEGKIGLIIGQDLASEFEKWKNAGQLAQKADLILVHRPEEEFSRNAVKQYGNESKNGFTGTFATEELYENFPYPHKVLNNPLFSASSTEIRLRLSEGQDLGDLVPQKVYCYIKERKLYGYKN